MPITIEPFLEQHIGALDAAVDFIPKRALQYFLEADHRDPLCELMQEAIQDPHSFGEEESRLPFYTLMIFASLKDERAIPWVREIGMMEESSIDDLFGERLLDSISLAFAALFESHIDALKALICDLKIHPIVRASCFQSLMHLYGWEVISRDDLAAFARKVLQERKEKIPFLYDVVAGCAIALHPQEMIGDLRAAYKEGYIESEELTLEDVEAMLDVPKAQAILEGKELFQDNLDDLVSHFEMVIRSDAHDRNDACPCGSGLKYKKCCR